ncbi:MAG: leucyl aminopeptidase [Gammaproteobacteria bacterium]|nr:leucyl aminopeptidase [Gammaproteobacteria bacterium]MDH4253985.1 leucyl aminopeptidase [Gammaproteobacteria bacterium]MDH5308874.1 leucyl aminopeptidase [Gammaproteobacteria bacterium]
MEYVTTTSAASRFATGCLIVGVFDDGRLGAVAEQLDAACKGRISQLVKQGDVSGEIGSASVCHAPEGIRAKRLLIAGMGKQSEFGVRNYRRAVAAAMDALRDSKLQDIAVYLTLEDVPGTNAYYRTRYALETIGNKLYRFDNLKSEKQRPVMPLKKIAVAAATRSDAGKAGTACEHADAIVNGMALARTLGDMPPNICTPSYLARTAQQLAKKHRNLDCRVLNAAEIKRLGMHSFLSVARGTVEPAKLIVMKYKGAQSGAPTVLVGKGITFDSGGISLKPGLDMDEMKFDMCGAAAVIGTMAAVATLKLPINVNVIVPTCENLPSGTATRPGDIVRSMSGQTIEILNTDAEGRLILCDALTYARRFKPASIVDVATLTGACVIALGHHMTAIMSNDEGLGSELFDSSVGANDLGWRMPMSEDYEDQLKSNFADVANIGGRDGGAVTAACFLGKFAEGMKWAHLDIAGTAWRSGEAKGATGRPVPMLAEFLLRRAKALP